MLWQAILAAALGLPVYKADVETPGERLERLTTIADSIDYASARATCTDQPAGCRRVWPGTRKELAALLLAQAWHETRLAEHVHADRCRPKECDRGRSKSSWQVQPSSVVKRAEWESIGGTDIDSTKAAAWAAARMLGINRFRCGRNQADWVAPTIAGYARGNACEWSGAAGRAATYRRVLAKL